MAELPIPFTFSDDEVFPNLPRAPIIEAVIQFQGRAEVPWEEKAIIERLKAALPDYRLHQSQRTLEQKFVFKNGKSQSPFIRDLGWKGVQFKSPDQKHIASFYRDSFSFSRLAPYAAWDDFVKEALRLWPIHVQISRVSEISRLGVRFINQVVAPVPTFDPGQYFASLPVASTGLSLPLVHFFHNSRFAVPGHPYGVNVIRAVQPAPTATATPSVILDVDVFTTVPLDIDAPSMPVILRHFRWLKNKMFFENFSKTTLDSFR